MLKISPVRWQYITFSSSSQSMLNCVIKKGCQMEKTTFSSKKRRLLVITPKKVWRIMAGIILVLLAFQVFHVISETLGYNNKLTEYAKHFFNFHSENNFPAFISALFLMLAGILSLIMGYSKSSGENRYHEKWKVLGYLFFFLACDEAIQIHEVISRGIRSNFGEQLPDFLHYAWVIPYALLVIGAVSYFFKFVWNLPRRIRNLILMAGSVYVFGALGVEVVESYVFSQVGVDNLWYQFLVTAEESMEMLGVTIMCYALVDHLSSHAIEIQFKAAPVKQARVSRAQVSWSRRTVISSKKRFTTPSNF